MQFGDKLTGSLPWNKDTNLNEQNALFQWPTKFVPDFSGGATDNPNMPVNMDFLFKADESKLRTMNYDQQLNILKSGARSGVPKPVNEADKLKDDEQPFDLQNLRQDAADDDLIDLRDDTERAKDQADAEAVERLVNRVTDADDDLIDLRDDTERAEAVERLVNRVTEARYNAAPVAPALPANPTKEDYTNRINIAAHRLKLLTAPVTYGEARAFLKGLPVNATLPPPAPVAKPVAKPVSSAAATTASAASAAPAAPAAASAASASASASAGSAAGSSAVPLPVLQAPSAPSKKKRAATDVFAGIFGGGDDTPQPLNPAHRSDAGAGAGSTGRSFQRRGKGSEKK
jgi:hypothetical protein